MSTLRFIESLAMPLVRFVLGQAENVEAEAVQVNAFMPGESDMTNQAALFYAYGCACVILFLFTGWSMWQTQRLEKKVKYLTERFEKAYPGQIDSP